MGESDSTVSDGTASSTAGEPACAPGPSSSKVQTPEDKAKVETAYMNLVQGKRHLLIDDVPSAVTSLQEAVKTLAETYGEMADECAEAYLQYGRALLAQSRLESGVLGAALEGAHAGESELESSQVSNPEALSERERNEVIKSVEDALDTNFNELMSSSQLLEKGAAWQNKMDAVVKEVTVISKGKGNKHLRKIAMKLHSLLKEAAVLFDEAAMKLQLKGSGVTDEEQENETDDEKKENSLEVDGETEEMEKENETSEEGEEEQVEEAEEMKEEVEIAAEAEEQDGGSEDMKKQDGESEEMETEENSADASEDDDEEEGGAEEGENEEGEEGEEGAPDEDEGEETTEKPEADEGTEDDEDVSTLQIAWETLELAKIIFGREQTDEAKTKEKRLKLSQAHLSLGEVGLEMETYDQAITDFQTCLEIQKEYLEPTDRLIAETHYNLGNAYGLKDDFDKAVEEYSSTLRVLQERITSLKKSIEENVKEDDPSTSVEKVMADPFNEVASEIKELEGLIPDIKEKIADVQASQAEWKRKSELAAKGDGLGDGCAPSSSGASAAEGSGNVKSGSAAANKPITNISHLVRKKRKADEDASTESSTKVAKTDENATVLNGASAVNGK